MGQSALSSAEGSQERITRSDGKIWQFIQAEPTPRVGLVLVLGRTG